MRFSTRRAALRAGLFICALVLAAGCLTHPAEGTSGGPKRDSSVMDTTELRENNYSTVYDAISARHADWLLPRGGPTGATNPVLGIWIEGNNRAYGTDYLRYLRPVDVRQVRRLTTTESLHTYSWPWGGLVITLR